MAQISDEDKAKVAAAIEQLLTQNGMDQSDAASLARGVVDQAVKRQGR
jgi:hypothetical protein